MDSLYILALQVPKPLGFITNYCIGFFRMTAHGPMGGYLFLDNGSKNQGFHDPIYFPDPIKFSSITEFSVPVASRLCIYNFQLPPWECREIPQKKKTDRQYWHGYGSRKMLFYYFRLCSFLLHKSLELVRPATFTLTGRLSSSLSTKNKRNPKKKILFFQMRTINSWSYNAENFFWMQKGILPSE